MKPEVCVTEKEYYKAEPIFKGSSEFKCVPVPSQETALAEAITKHRAFAAVIGVDRYNDKLYNVLPRGGIIARFGVGHDGISKANATKGGIIVSNTPGVLDDSVAEHAIWLLGSLARQVASHNTDMKADKWQPKLGLEMRAKILLVLGCGKIGCKVAKIASFGFGMNVIGYDIAQLDAQEMKQKWGILQVFSSLDEAIARADVISLHLPATEATKHFVGKEFLMKMPKHAFLINTARGSIIDEAALYDAVAASRIAGAALDVFENEPYVPVDSEKDLRKLSTVLLTPHIGSSTVEACKRMAHRVLANIKACYERRFRQLDILNPEVIDVL
ncbi:MAG: NAD(P)-dependent oxidoreductase [Planctomycetota bacterium]